MRTIKEALVWTYDWDKSFAFAEELEHLIEKYNGDFPHQALNYMTLCQYREIFNKEQEPVLT